VIVVATDDFEVYHEVVTELRERGIDCTTVEPGEQLPAKTDAVVTTSDDDLDSADTPDGTNDRTDAVPVIHADPGAPREAVEKAVAALRNGGGRRIIGIDPGEKPGIAVLDGEVVVATFHVPPEQVPAVVAEETENATDPLVRIGDGARLVGARLIEDIDDVPVELVDETGTTPYLGAGTRGIGDVLAAVNIARMEGEPIDSRDVQPTEGELQRVQERSREESEHNRTISIELARRVALGELTMDEALDEHREG
jgi:hypothetical protein